jgi:transposase
LIPVEECQAVVPCIPSECRRCGRTLHGIDPEPLRHQIWELPDIQPVVTEYQRHRLVCACGSSTCGELPSGMPIGQAGPRLVAFSGLLMACFRQSKRRAAQFLSTILNQPASASWMVLLQNRCAEAVQPAYDELARQLPTQDILNIDESPTKEGSSKAWVWTVVAQPFTFFACRPSRLRREGYFDVVEQSVVTSLFGGGVDQFRLAGRGLVFVIGSITRGLRASSLVAILHRLF